ncbi:hypothetical protein V2G26_013414 [Clonostachys chloroleuca]
MGPPTHRSARQIHRQHQKPLQHKKPPARPQKRAKETPYFAVFEPFQIIYCQSCKDLVPTSSIAIGIHLQGPCYSMPPGPKLDKAALQARALLTTTEDDRNMIRRRGS